MFSPVDKTKLVWCSSRGATSMGDINVWVAKVNNLIFQ
jgi:hypothetical protein